MVPGILTRRQKGNIHHWEKKANTSLIRDARRERRWKEWKIIRQDKVDKSTNVYNNVQFEITLTEVPLSSKSPYGVTISIGPTECVVLLTRGLVQTRTMPKLIDEDYLKPQCKRHIKRLQSWKLRTATNEGIHIEGMIPLTVLIGDLQARIGFGIIQNWAAIVLLGIIRMDNLIWEYSIKNAV